MLFNRVCVKLDNFDHVKKNIEEVRKSINAVNSSVILLGVTKTFPAGAVLAAAAEGITQFGESKLQEAAEKIGVVSGEKQGLKWHFIGHLQTNKAGKVSRLFDCIQSLDSVKLAEKINEQLTADGKTIDVLLELKVSEEESKFGISPDAAAEALEMMKVFTNIHVRGLMTMAPYSDNPENARPYFKRARQVFDSLKKYAPGASAMEVLSMGMSDDYITAMEEGSTMVRIGTGIFGKRVSLTGNY
jgi:pyridoxal phosphate enzyme (YggS family)